MRRPTTDELREAAEWLRTVNPSTDSAKAFKRVASWLEQQAQESAR